MNLPSVLPTESAAGKKWQWAWDKDTDSEEDKWNGYKKRYLNGKDKFLHFGKRSSMMQSDNKY